MLNSKKLEGFAKSTHGGSSVTLSIEESDEFLTYLIDQSVLKNNCRIVRMNKPDKYINAIGYGDGRFLVPSGSFSSDYYKTSFDGNQIQLTTQKARGAVVINDDDIEDYKANPGVDWTDTVMKLIAAKCANEIEEVCWISDTASLSGFESTDLRSKFDGWRYQIVNSQDGDDYENDVTGSATLLDAALNSGHTTDFRIAGGISEYDADGEPPWEHKFGKMLKSMPSEYWNISPNDMRFWNHPKITMDYLEALSGRNTELGDKAILGVADPRYNLVPIVNAPKMSVLLDADGVEAGGTYTDSLLTPSQNLILGLQRELKLEKYRDAANERDIYFFSIRMCVAVENANAAVLTYNLTY